jgi:3-hydroxyacyl-[acyl-carrier-protein] dehydratase
MRFILVDRITELEPGRSIVAEKTLSPDEELFGDHFPGFPVVPGVLLVEMMAQAAGKCLDALRTTRGKAMLVQIRSARFKQWVMPGQTAEIRSSIVSNQETVASASCSVRVSDRNVCTSDLLFTFVPWDQFAADSHDSVLDQFLAGRSGSAAGGPLPR